MKYLLDSNVWISLLRGKNVTLREAIKGRPREQIFLCPVVLAELWYGAIRSGLTHRHTNEELISELRANYPMLPFDEAAAIDSAELRTELESIGMPIGPYDLLIAAIARTHHATLVTHNTGEFARVRGLLLEDWQTDSAAP